MEMESDDLALVSILSSRIDLNCHINVHIEALESAGFIKGTRSPRRGRRVGAFPEGDLSVRRAFPVNIHARLKYATSVWVCVCWRKAEVDPPGRPADRPLLRNTRTMRSAREINAEQVQAGRTRMRDRPVNL